MINTVILEHPDFVVHKLTIMKKSIVTSLLYDGKKIKFNLKKQFKLLDDHGQERICKFKTVFPALTPGALIIDNKETIPFELPVKIPNLAYILLVPNVLFLIGGAIGGALGAINVLFTLTLFGWEISNFKKCLYSILNTVFFLFSLYLIVYLFKFLM